MTVALARGMKNLVLVSLVLACAAATLKAQLPTKVLPPSGVAYEGNTISSYPFQYSQCRMQQVIDGAYLAKQGALVFDFAFRRATSGTIGGYAIKGVTFNNFTVQLGTTSKTPATLSTTFSANRTTAMTTVVNGTYKLPEQPKVNRPAAFNIVFKLSRPWAYDPRNGNLLLEFAQAEAKQQYTGYWIDGTRRNSYGRFFGKGMTGRMANGDRPLLSFASPYNAVPGGKIALQLSWPRKSYPATLFVGFSTQAWGAIPMPLDLAALGAPGNKLYTGAEFRLPMSFTKQTNGRYLAKTELNIPNDQRLAGWHAFFQSYLVDPPSNSLGLVFTNYAEVEIGGGPVFTQTVSSSRQSATTGYVNKTSPSGPVIRFSGVFN
ncbi:MAG: hypothetical protein ACYST0_06860 [Planctomycetota bacterium]|jgi:hypothetical protein